MGLFGASISKELNVSIIDLPGGLLAIRSMEKLVNTNKFKHDDAGQCLKLLRDIGNLLQKAAEVGGIHNHKIGSGTSNLIQAQNMCVTIQQKINRSNNTNVDVADREKLLFNLAKLNEHFVKLETVLQEVNREAEAA